MENLLGLPAKCTL